MARLPQMPELSPNLSAQGIASGDLALDLLLHDIAEHALEITRASGAAIALDRDGAMVCRAAAGVAPGLGIKIDIRSGLTGACVRERKLQWCSDTERDARVDAEASRGLGVRSIVVMPIFAGPRLIGVLEIFSPEPDAFHDGDVRALEESARWIADTVRKSAPVPPVPEGLFESREPVAVPVPRPVTAAVHAPTSKASAVIPAMVRTTTQLLAKSDRTTRILRGVAVALAVLLVVLLISRWTRRGSTAPQGATMAQAAQPITVSEPSPQSGGPDVSVTQLKPQSGRPRRGPANNAALRILDDSAAPAESRGLKSDSVDKQPAPGSETGSSAQPAKAEAQPTSKSSSIPDQELAAIGPGPLRSVPATLGTSVAPPVVDVPQPPISQGVVEGRLIHSVQPKYPPEAVVRRIEGMVVLHAVIGKDGSLRQVKSVRGDGVLTRAAEEAVLQWRYEPYKLNGSPVEMPIDITINFNLPK